MSSLPRPKPLPPLTLILGGARSGKSRFAEGLALQAERPYYLATGQAWDTEMADRIKTHKAQRGPQWDNIEEPLALTDRLKALSVPEKPILVDCLTLWLTNLMMAEYDIAVERQRLLECLPDLPGPVLFVSNEVGFGIVPDNALARRFRDEAGRLHQALAARADSVYLLVAGIPMTVKSI